MTRRLCLFGGSFDPVHAGHLHLACAAREAAQLDELIFLPAARSPFKCDSESFFSNEQRVALLRSMTRELSWASISELDLKLPPPSWSWRIVEHMRAAQPHSELYWLMGTDQWEQLHRWARYDYLCEQLTFLVYHRQNAPQPREQARAIFLEGDHPASSSELRDCFLHDQPIPEGWMDEASLALARSYQSKPSP